jgi:hypothetical protein
MSKNMPQTILDFIDLAYALEKGHKTFDEAQKYYEQNYYFGRKRLLENHDTRRVVGIIVDEYRKFYGWE